MDYNVTSDGYTVRDIEQNWAAEYAKRLTEQEAKTRSEADTNLNTKIGNLAVSVNSGEAIGDGVITTDKIDERAVTSDKLALLSVKGEHIREQNITTGKIHDLNVTTVKLADRAVTTDKLADRVVTKDKLARWAVTNEKIEPGAVTSDKLFDVFASIVEVRNGVADNKAVTPYTLKHGIGDIIPMCVINGDLFLENVNVETIGADVTSISHNPVKDAGLRTYSITPVQVGTWIDGTPIWRQAFKVKCKDDLTAAEYGDLIAAGEYEPELPVTDKTKVLLLNVSCSVCSSVDKPSYVNDRYLIPYSETGSVRFDFSVFGSVSVLPLHYADLENEGFVGYIEFVTSASNIITS
ncbi:MAG: hypothetical protein IJH37_05055 [Clostridia bacterium]|nr:hypothetical protein [Clostridia bacterium]